MVGGKRYVGHRNRHAMTDRKPPLNRDRVINREPVKGFADIPRILSKKRLTFRDEARLREADAKLRAMQGKLRSQLSGESADNPELNDRVIWAGDMIAAIRKRIRVG